MTSIVTESHSLNSNVALKKYFGRKESKQLDHGNKPQVP